MKLSAQEEYGLRCLLQMARREEGGTVTIPEISLLEGLSIHNVGKLLRLLRLRGLVESARGQAGGYRLARPPDQITVGEVLDLLGGRFFGPNFCERHAGMKRVCVHSKDCSLRCLLGKVQLMLDHVLGKTTLKDLICSEQQMSHWLEKQIR